MKSILIIAGVLMTAPGFGDVAPNGTFHQSIPLAIPAGTNDVAPKLAFSFSSVSGNGLLGTGWSLSGLATISRVADGKGIRYDGDDRYISPHGRLLKADPSDPQSYYLAENHNLVRYYPIGTCGDGPCSWRVQHPDGSKQYFGGTHDARIEARLESRPTNKQDDVRVWAINEQQDRFGNSYRVSYAEYPATGDYYPDTITYTLGNGLKSFKTIHFGYGEKPGDSPQYRSDSWAKYQLNSLVQQRFLLRWVSIKIDGKLLRRYKLDYDTSSFSRLSRLRSIAIVGSDDKTTSAPHRFDWQDKPLRVDFTRQTKVPGLTEATFDPKIAQIHTGDFNGDGKTDFLKTDVVQNFWLVAGRDQDSFDYKVIAGKNYEQDATLIIGDYDGDGISDILKMNGTKPHWVGFGSNTGEFTYKEPFDAIRYSGVKHLAAGDFNGDGRMDIFKFCGSGEPTWIAYGNVDQTFTVKEDVLQNSCSLWDDNSKVFNGDYNMDGRSDLLVISPRGEHFGIFSTADGFRVATKIPGLVNLAYDPATDQLEAGDFNGDGISDLMGLNVNRDHWLILARGDGTFSRQRSLGGLANKVFAKDTGSIVVGDINGDSLADLFQLDSRGEYNWGVISTGDGSFDAIPITGLAGRFDPDWQVRIGDTTGKNRSDFLFFLPDGRSQMAFNPAKVQDALIGITEPRGKAITIDYQHTTQFDQLIKPGSDDCSVGLGSLRSLHHGTAKTITKARGRATCGIADASVRYIVSQVTYANGPFANGPIANKEGATGTQIYSYDYENARYYPGTIGEYAQLGFEKLVKRDLNTGIRTVTYFHQDKPLQGHPARIQKFSGNGALRYQEDRQYKLLMPIATNPEIFVTKPIAKRITTYEASPAGLAQVAAVETHQLSYDALGFEVEDIVCTGNDTNYQSQCKTVSKSYLQDFAGGLQGQLSAQRIVNSAGQVQSWQRYRYKDGQLSRSEQFYCADSDDCQEATGSWQTLREVLAVDRHGQVSKERNIRGNVVTKVFDPRFHHLVVMQSNSLGHEQATEYDALLRPVARIDVNGHVTSYSYDALGRVSAVTKPSGAKLLTEYRDEGDPAKQRRIETTHDGTKAVAVKTLYYDGFDLNYKTTEREIVKEAGKQAEAISQTQRVTWQMGRRVHETSDKHFASEEPLYTTKLYDRSNRLIKTTSKDGLETTTSYQAGSVTVTTPKGSTIAQVNAYGLVTERKFPDGRTLRYDYDANQKLSRVTTSTGQVTTFSYDSAGRKTAMVDPSLGTIRYRYSPAGDLLEQVDNKGIATTYQYDVLGRITSKAVGSQQPLIYSYDSGTKNSTGRLAKVAGAFGYKQISYTPSGKVALTAYSYENLGTAYTESLRYDPLDRVTAYTFPDGTVQSYRYDGLGRFTKIFVDDKLLASYQGYDAAGRVGIKEVNNGFRGEAKVTQDRYVYDRARDTIAELATVAVGSGNESPLQNIRYSYNQAAELAHITDLRPSTTVTGDDGEMVDTSVSQSFRYDALGQLSEARGIYGTKAFSYDQNGNIIRRQGQVYDELSYNAKNQLASSPAIEVIYDKNGNLVSKRHKADGTTWQYQYNDENRLIAVLKNGKALASYAYNEAGRRYKKIIYREGETSTTWYISGSFELVTSGSRSGTAIHRHYYGVDQQRLATETSSTAKGLGAILAPDHGQWAAALTPLSLGNIQHSLADAGQWLKEAITVDRLLALLAVVFTLLFGLLLSQLRLSHKLTLPRALRLAGHTALGYVMAATLSTAAYGDSGSFPLAHQGASQQVFYHYNYLGSATLLTDHEGKIVKRYVYSPYGEVDAKRSVGKASSSIRFAGYQADDETGLLYVNARYYDASLGRFLTPDLKVPKDGRDALGLNRYAYVKNNPISYIDPTGHSWFAALWKRASEAVGQFIERGVAAIKQSVAEASFAFKLLANKVIDQGKKFLSRHKKQIFTWAVKTATAAVHAAITSFAGPVAGGMVAGLFSGFVTGAGMTLMNGGSFVDALKVGLQQAAKSIPQGAMMAVLAGPIAPAVSSVSHASSVGSPGDLVKLLKSGVNTVVKTALDYSKVLFKSVADTVKSLSFIKALDDNVIQPGIASKLVDHASGWLLGAAQEGLKKAGAWLNAQIDELFATGQKALAPAASVYTSAVNFTRRLPGQFDRFDLPRMAFGQRAALTKPLMSPALALNSRGGFQPFGGMFAPPVELSAAFGLGR